MTSNVYFIQAVGGGPIKIGVALDVKERLVRSCSTPDCVRHWRPGDHEDAWAGYVARTGCVGSPADQAS